MHEQQIPPAASQLGKNIDQLMRLARIAVFLLLAAALLTTTVRAVLHFDAQFGDGEAYLANTVNADVNSTARTFASEGIWKLRAVPVDNNPPIGSSDVYAHWPPLLTILLASCFHFFGASEHTSHIFMLGVVLITATLVTRLGWKWLGPIGGALAGYFWLTFPVTIQYGALAAQPALATLFMVAAILAFYSSKNKIGALLLLLGAISSWEAVLVVPILWLAAWSYPKARQSALWGTVGATVGVCGVAALYLGNNPSLAIDTLQTAKFYLGLSTTYTHKLTFNSDYRTPSQQIILICWNHAWMLGVLGSGALIQLFLDLPEKRDRLLLALAGPWLLWCTTMRLQTALNPFELMIAAPIAALALAQLATMDLRIKPSKLAVVKTAVFVVLAAIQFLIIPHPKRDREQYSPNQLIRFSTEIKNATLPGSIVLSPVLSAVPIYYSERHIVRGIASQDAVNDELPIIRTEFPNAPIYLAIPPFLAPAYQQTLSHATIVSSSPDTLVARL